jgi:hypothetical protein
MKLSNVMGDSSVKDCPLPLPILPRAVEAMWRDEWKLGEEADYFFLSIRQTPARTVMHTGTWRVAWGTQRNSGSCCVGWCDSPHLIWCFQIPWGEKNNRNQWAFLSCWCVWCIWLLDA